MSHIPSGRNTRRPEISFIKDLVGVLYVISCMSSMLFYVNPLKIYVDNNTRVSKLNKSLLKNSYPHHNCEHTFSKWVIKSYVMIIHAVCCHSKGQTTETMNKNVVKARI